MAGVAHTLRSLRHPNYRLFFVGQGISVIGSWMQNLGMQWMVYRMTGSAIWLGVVAFSNAIMSFLLGPLAGVAADRFRRRRLVVFSQTLAMLQAAVLAALTLSGRIELWHMVVLSAFAGMVHAMDIPFRQSFVIELVPRADLPNAIAMNSFLVNGGRLIGPALAGLLVVWLDRRYAGRSEGICFLINAVSFLAVLVALLAMRLPNVPVRVGAHNVLDRLREGFGYTVRHKQIRSALLLLAFIGMVGMPYQILMSVFAKDVLHGDSRTMGWLLSACGAGAIVAAVVLASRRGGYGIAYLAAAPCLLGAGMIGFALSRTLWLSMAMLLLAGFGQMIQMAGTNTFIQSVVDDDKRGRVLSFYSMAFMGTAPFGQLLMGFLAEHFSAPLAVALGGGGCLAAAAVFGYRILMRRAAPPAAE